MLSVGMHWEVLTANRKATSTRESVQNTRRLFPLNGLSSSLKTLRRPLEEQFVAECLRAVLCGPAFREREVGEFIDVGFLSEGGRHSAQQQRAPESEKMALAFHHSDLRA